MGKIASRHHCHVFLLSLKIQETFGQSFFPASFNLPNSAKFAMSRSRLNRRQSFQPSCPLGGQWYVCDSGSKFVGCCSNEPCSFGCRQGNLKPASFDPAYYGTFPDLECNSGNWYTCSGTNPPFMGCCESDPCNRGCPTEDLAAGWVGNNEAIACQFYAQGCSSPSSSTTASRSSATRFSNSLTTSLPSSSTHSSSSSTTAPPAPTSGKSSTGTIVGGAVGGVVGIAIVVILLFYCYRHAAKSRKNRNSEFDTQNSQQKAKSLPDATEAFSEPSTRYQGLSISFLIEESSQNLSNVEIILPEPQTPQMLTWPLA